METWPATLPQIEIGAEESRQTGFIRSPTDQGPGKQRPRFTAVSRFASGTIFMDSTQKATFETFYQTTLGQGGDEFSYTDPFTATSVTARFVSPPSAQILLGGTPDGSLWRVSVSLEILP